MSPAQKAPKDRDVDPRQWSRRELLTLITDTAARMINDKRRDITRDVGVVSLEGTLDFAGAKGELRALVDNSDVAQFLNIYGKRGTRVRLIVVQDPGRGQDGR